MKELAAFLIPFSTLILSIHYSHSKSATYSKAELKVSEYFLNSDRSE